VMPPACDPSLPFLGLDLPGGLAAKKFIFGRLFEVGASYFRTN